MYWLWFTALVVALVAFQYQSWQSSSSAAEKKTPMFIAFQRQYLLIYYLVMFSDWLQGSYVYALYKSYNMSLQAISQLFIAGFLSSGIMGSIVGGLADKFGRKKLAVAFGVIYGSACLTKLYNSFAVLMFGRVLSGVATSLLFSVFESWMVYEHKNRGFAGELISDTFSKAIWGNGIAAIVSGLVASFAVDSFGVVAPFMLSFATLCVSTLLVSSTWTENYGDSSIDVATTFSNAWKSVRANPQVMLLGWIQSLFEASMYIFVFMWSPALDDGSGTVPYGLIFACFMVAIMIGSSIFSHLVATYAVADVVEYNLGVASVALVGCAISSSPVLLMFFFVLFELCCGVYFPSIGTLRSRIIPEETRSAVMNFFRIPLNFLVVAALLKVGDLPVEIVFGFCSVCMLVATYLMTQIKRQDSDDLERLSEDNIPLVDTRED